MDFLNAVEVVNQDTIEQEQFSVPVIMFLSGDAKLAKKVKGVEGAGGWFMPQDSAGDRDLSDAGWTQDNFTTGNGDTIEGWSKPEIKVMLVARRRRWELRDGNGSYPWKMSKQAKKAADEAGVSMRGHMQCIVLVEGLEEMGPLMLAFRGHAQMAFNGDMEYRSTGALSQFGGKIIAKANEAARKAGKTAKFDSYCFWLTVGASKDEKGKPKFHTVGSGNNTSQIVVPVPVGLPENGHVELNDYYVGTELVKEGAEVKAMLAENGWLTVWDSLDGVQAEDKKIEEAKTKEENTDNLFDDDESIDDLLDEAEI